VIEQNEKQTTELVAATPMDVAAGTAPAMAPQMSLVELAISKGAGLDVIEKMMDLQERNEKNIAKKAYVEAISSFKASPPTIKKDKINLQYKSKYCSLENLVSSVIPSLAECGLSHQWIIDQQGQIINVSCILTHSLGHSESVSMGAPPDDSGKKNPIQKMKSTITYLKSVTFESILGLAATDANDSDDGNGAGPKQITFINERQQGQILDMMNSKSVDQADFLGNYLKVASVEMIPVSMFASAMADLEAVKVPQ